MTWQVKKMSEKRTCGFCKKYIPSMADSHGGEDCKFRKNVTCLKCCMKGHVTAECSMTMTCKRPVYLEDLISDEDKERWQITTKRSGREIGNGRELGVWQAEVTLSLYFIYKCTVFFIF